MTSIDPRVPLKLALALLLAASAAAGGQAPPSPADVLGYEMGERFTDARDVVRYMNALGESAPGRVGIRPYGRTIEGRELIQVVIAREDHLRRLDRILELNRRLRDPDLGEDEARAIAAQNPAIVYLSYGVHGNESSSSEAALWTAWDLVRDAEPVAGVLDSVVVVIDPVVNPDGRDRYVNYYKQARGGTPNPDADAREHLEPWPGGRVNHYLFDLNRDWSWMTQPETRARLATWDTWSPQVHVDFHEMSWRSTYFFFPAAEPINPIYPAHILEWGRRFGAANARAFDRQGWPYYTAEGFDLFYPGYGDSWPALTGAIGMTYEQAGGGRAGLVVERPDGTTLSLAERTLHHRTTGQATLRTAAAGRSRLLEDFARFHRTVDEGLPDFLLVPGREGGAAADLVALLQDQGIAVERVASAFHADARPHPGFDARREFPAGTYLVRARQPRGRLAATLLQPETVLDATFSYDVSAWSLPYAYGVEAHAARAVPDAGWSPAPWLPRLFQEARDAPVAEGGAAGRGGSAPYGYLLPPGPRSWKGVVRFLAAGGRALVMDEPFTMDGRDWPAGTLFLPRYGNEALTRAVTEAGLGRAVPVWTGKADAGNDLGTGESYALESRRVALLAGDGISPTSHGAHWFFLERTLGLSFDILPVDAVEPEVIEPYDVMVVPDATRLPEVLADRLRSWVESGGTLIAVAGAARALAEPVAGIEPREAAVDDSVAVDVERALRGREERELERWEEQVPGAILPVTLDPAHPLAFGAGTGGGDRLHVLHRGGLAFEPAEGFESVGHFPPGMRATSGVISQENLDRLARGSWLGTRRLGRGRVVLFADDPVFRHFWYATYQPYINALMVGF